MSNRQFASHPGSAYPALLPCPFCGQTPEWRVTQTGRLAMIVCPAGSPCIGTGLAFYAEPDRLIEATEAWNRRQSPTTDSPISPQDGSTGDSQSRPSPARAGKVMESAVQPKTRQNSVPPGETGKMEDPARSCDLGGSDSTPRSEAQP